jgi:hypothetical protein
MNHGGAFVMRRRRHRSGGSARQEVGVLLEQLARPDRGFRASWSSSSVGAEARATRSASSSCRLRGTGRDYHPSLCTSRRASPHVAAARTPLPRTLRGRGAAAVADPGRHLKDAGPRPPV